jgi:hypothetical protein
MLSWETKADQTRPRHRQETAGWTWLKSGFGEGPRIGGCLESLQHLRGTPYWPDWNGAIMFFETSEEKPTPETVDGILMDYENMGVLEKLSGMLVGRSMFYSEPEKQQLREIILARTEKFRFPIITEMDFGHTAPQFILPLGCRARIDGHQGTFEIIEAAVQNPTILVSLSDLIDELDTANEEFPTFLNLQTGKIVAVTSEALAVPQGTRSPDTVLEWEQEMVDLALEIVDKNTYLKLPSPSQINEADIIKNFSQNYPDPQLSSALLATSQSGSPLQRFKTTLQQHNIEQEWYAYKTNALEQIALEWLKANKLSYS